jgi:hypothetical protein
MGDTDALTPATVSPVPRVLIDGVAIEVRRLMLAPAEVARVLRVEEADVATCSAEASCATCPQTAGSALILKR